MKYNIKINDEILEKDIPNAWHLLSFKDFIGVVKAGDELPKLLSVFTGLDPEILEKAEIKNFDVLMSSLAFLKTEMNLVMPSEVLGITVPRNLEQEAVARYADIQDTASMFKEDDKIYNLEQYPFIVAVYLTPSPYNYQEAEKLAERLKDAPCVEVVAVANFTLLKLDAWNRGMPITSHLEGTTLNRWRQVILLWLHRLSSSIRYYTWKRSLHSHVRNYLNGR